MADGALHAVILSPPYADAAAHPSLGSVNKDGWGTDGRDIVKRRGLSASYGATAGNLGGLPVGDLAAIVTSPPYSDSLSTVKADVDEKMQAAKDAGKTARRATWGANKGSAGWSGDEYGSAVGQLGSLRPGTPPGESPVSECEQLDWPMSQVYGQGWGDLIVPEAYAHPAKFSRLLVFKIVSFMLERGYVAPGSTVGDPFGGVALGGIACAYSGLRWFGVELEPRFVELAQKNIALHARELSILGCPLPVIVQGDSRKFAAVVRDAAAVVTSPPYAETLAANNPDPPEVKTVRPHLPPAEEVAAYLRERRKAAGLSRGDIDRALGTHTLYSWYEGRPAGTQIPTPEHWRKLKGILHLDDRFDHGILTEVEVEATGKNTTAGRFSPDSTYGTTEGNVGALPAGDLAAVVTSPPYAESVKGDHGERETAEESRAKRKTPGGSLGQSARNGGYGVSEGQLGALPPGDVAAVLTSPFAASLNDKPSKQVLAGSGGRMGVSCKNDDGYGTTEGQVGRESGDTYWAAVRDIYAQCHQALRPNGWLVCVVKDYVSKGAVVPLCDQTAALLEHLGFEVRIRVRAWLTSEREQPDLFGGTVKDGVSRKSFFRRLHERKRPDLRIDWETVLFARKPGGGGGDLAAVCTSPPWADVPAHDTRESYDKHPSSGRMGKSCGTNYGSTPGNVGNLPVGTPPEAAP